jgi:hypothetical protein
MNSRPQPDIPASRDLRGFVVNLEGTAGMSETLERNLRTLLHVGCFTLVTLVGLSPSLAADWSQGKIIAERWCTGCHVVEREQKNSAVDQAPPFASLAKTPGFDANKLAMLLLKPHPNMPELALSREEVANLAEYILTLK